MKQKIIKLFFMVCLLATLPTMSDAPKSDNLLSDTDLQILDEQINHSLVYINKATRKSIIELAHIFADHEWSINFKNICQDIADDGTVAPYEQVARVIDECIDICKQISPNQMSSLQCDLETYKEELQTGKAHLSFDNQNEPATKKHSVKKICKLCVGCLAVTGHLFVNGVEITGNAPSGNGATGPTGATGATGATGSSSPGSVTSTNITGCDDAVARFDGTATTVINNAPLRALDVASGTQATSPLLADDCLTTNLNLALIPKGTGALIAAIPDGTATGGNARGINAVDLQMVRSTNTQVASGTQAAIGGGQNNTASGFISTVAGGRSNSASGDNSTIAGGTNNTASGNPSTIGGGQNNTTSGDNSTVAGGISNTASGTRSTIGGGNTNTASGVNSTVGGGNTNTASGVNSTVPGGQSNIALGTDSFAAGVRAHANHNGAFVWADSTGLVFASTVSDQFRVRATGGAQVITAVDGGGLATAGAEIVTGASAWSAVSDRNRKENFNEVDTIDILNTLANIPIQSWNYKAQDESIRHIGPMAQDFNPAFGFNETPLSISTLDFDGVALAAIQGLYKLHEQKIRDLEDRYDLRMSDLENIIKQLLKQQQMAE